MRNFGVSDLGQRTNLVLQETILTLKNQLEPEMLRVEGHLWYISYEIILPTSCNTSFFFKSANIAIYVLGKLR